MTTLDKLIAAHGMPRYIKIDVEGFEEDVLMGLGQPVPMLSVEYLPAFRDRTVWVIDMLERLGRHRFNLVTGEARGFLWSAWRTAAETRGWLASLPGDAPSGDLYARLSMTS